MLTVLRTDYRKVRVEVEKRWGFGSNPVEK